VLLGKRKLSSILSPFDFYFRRQPVTAKTMSEETDLSSFFCIRYVENCIVYFMVYFVYTIISTGVSDFSDFSPINTNMDL
jgi:hypothetical protein